MRISYTCPYSGCMFKFDYHLSELKGFTRAFYACPSCSQIHVVLYRSNLRTLYVRICRLEVVEVLK